MSSDKTLHDELIDTDSEPDEVVRGVTSAPTPKAKRVRPIAGFVLIALVAIAALYMQDAMKSRQAQKRAETDTAKSGQGPADRVERSLLDDQAKHGIDTGQNHVADIGQRSSISGLTSTDGGSIAKQGNGSVPPLQYKPGGAVPAAASGQLSPEEQRRLHEYQLEQEAIESATAIKVTTGGGVNGNMFQTNAESQSQKSVLSQALDNIRAQEQEVLKGQQSGNGLAAQGNQALAALTGNQRAVNGSLPQTDSHLQNDYEQQNAQQNKEAFLENASAKPAADYLTRARTQALGKYEVKSGWLIPAILEQQLNSDLPGMIRALVRENVYDSVTGKYMLIPAGSRLIGVYNSNIGYGQGAVQAVWTRVLFPDGSSMDLGKMEGDDSQGASGFRDQVSNHWGRVIAGALLTSAFAAGIEISQGQNSSVLQNPSYGQRIGEIVGQQVGQLGEQVTRRNLNIQPTIKVRPGYRFFVRVEKDLLFRAPYKPMPASE